MSIASFLKPRCFLPGLLSMAALAAPAFAQSEAKRTAVVIPAVEERSFKKNVFAGNEARIAAMNVLNADCTAVAVPDVRVVTQPAKGELRLETLQIAIDRDKND